MWVILGSCRRTLVVACAWPIFSDIPIHTALQGRHENTDYHLTPKDIANLRSKIDGLEWKYDPEQAQSIREFVRINPELVLCYQEFEPPSGSTSTPFLLGITTPELMDAAVEFGHDRPASMDSTFATNNLKARKFYPESMSRLKAKSNPSIHILQV